MSMTYDAVVVGARCAGAATAMLLARAGARVLLVDRGAYATDTLSTHALMRGAVLQLHRWECCRRSWHPAPSRCVRRRSALRRRHGDPPIFADRNVVFLPEPPGGPCRTGAPCPGRPPAPSSA